LKHKQEASRDRAVPASADFFLGLIYPEGGGNMFLRNVRLSPNQQKQAAS
jgi:hypothetical protein